MELLQARNQFPHLEKPTVLEKLRLVPQAKTVLWCTSRPLLSPSVGKYFAIPPLKVKLIKYSQVKRKNIHLL